MNQYDWKPRKHHFFVAEKFSHDQNFILQMEDEICLIG